jgi:hypothetical protein
VIFPVLKGLNLCRHILDKQLLHNLVLRGGSLPAITVTVGSQ